MSLTNRRFGVLLVVALAAGLAVLLAASRAWLPLAVFAAVALPALHLIAYPWRRCRWCEGGKVWDGAGLSFDDCAVCSGRGRRLRWMGLGSTLRAILGIPT